MRVKAAVVFDGDCGFCTWSAAKLERWVKPPATIIAWQHADLAGLGVTQADCESALQWVPALGTPVFGGRAVAALFLASPQPWRSLGVVFCAPGISWLVDRGYQIIATNRHRLPGAMPACATSPP